MENYKQEERSKSVSKFSHLTLEKIREMHSKFAKERNWEQFHQPRNILLALIGEIGEVAEHFQWKPDSECEQGLPKWTDDEREALGEELSDVLIYLIRFADRCQIDITKSLALKCPKSITKS